MSNSITIKKSLPNDISKDLHIYKCVAKDSKQRVKEKCFSLINILDSYHCNKNDP